MTLIDTSVWIDHLRASDARLVALLNSNQVLTHPFVVGEIAMGNVRQRSLVLGDLELLPSVVVAMDVEVRRFIDAAGLFGLGIGYIDAHLLASTRLTPGARLWTRDKRLAGVANQMNLFGAPP